MRHVHCLAGSLTLLVASDASTARAAPPELALGDQLLALEPGREFIFLDDPAPFARAVGFAQLTAGGRAAGDLGAGAAVALSGLNCDVLAGSMQGRLRPGSGELTGQATYSLCLLNAFLTLTFEGRRGTNVAPSLDARRSLWSRGYEEVYDRVTMGVGELWFGGAARHAVFLLSFGHGTTTQHDAQLVRTIKHLDSDVVAYRYRRRGRLQVDAIVWPSRALKAGDDDKGGVVNDLYPLRVRYDTPSYYVAAHAGWSFAGGVVTQSGETQVNGETTDSWSETVDSSGLPEMTILVGDLEAGVRRDRVTASAKLARSLFPTFDGNLAREARIAGAVTYLRGKTTLSLSPFATRTRTWARDAPSALALAAGASLHVGRPLSRRLRLDAIGEAGLSPYARLDGDRLASSFGGQLVVALSGRVARTDRDQPPR